MARQQNKQNGWTVLGGGKSWVSLAMFAQSWVSLAMLAHLTQASLDLTMFTSRTPRSHDAQILCRPRDVICDVRSSGLVSATARVALSSGPPDVKLLFP